MEIAGQRLTRDQREQNGADREIDRTNSTRVSKAHHLCKKGGGSARNVDRFRARYTVNYARATECRGRQPGTGCGVNAALAAGAVRVEFPC